MKRNNFLTILTYAVVFFTNCSKSPSNFMAFDEVIYVNSFPQTFNVENGVEPNINIIGITGFAVLDTLLIFSTTDKEGLWYFVSLPNYNFLGKFLTLGKGPFEFIQPPFANNKVQLIKEDNHLFAYIYDFHIGRFFRMNISNSLLTNELAISLYKDSLPPFLFNIVMIDTVKFFCKEVNYNHTQQVRYILNNNERTTPDFMQKLNQVSIIQGEDINILTTGTKYSDEHQLIVEMPVGLNYVNLYSLDGSFGKTICLGKKLVDIEQIQSVKSYNRLYRFSGLTLFNNFWGVVHLNESYKTYQTDRKTLPSIFLFDWNGNPLAELKMDRFITSFDIDFINGLLYTFDLQYDEFYQFDIKDILQKIKTI